jgi:hypothetical protein
VGIMEMEFGGFGWLMLLFIKIVLEGDKVIWNNIRL